MLGHLFSMIFLLAILIMMNYNFFFTKFLLLKPLQNKKGQKIWGTWEKSSPFIRKKTAFFSGTPNFFGPSYFEAALATFSVIFIVISETMQM